MKRFSSFVLCFALVLSVFSAEVFAADTFYEAGFDYEKVNGTARIVTYYGLGGDLVIPETLGGLPVSAVAEGAVSCQKDTQITSITLPKTLTSFSASAITGNVSLEKIVLDEENTSFCLISGVLYNSNQTRLVLYPSADPRTEYEMHKDTVIVESAAFYGASNLEKIVLSPSLKTIKHAKTNQPGVFENCTALKSVSLPFSLSVLGDYAFMGCTSLSSVFFPDSATRVSIGMGAFLNCPNLKNVRLYSNVDSIGAEAFGFLSYINDAAMMETTLAEDFCLYGINGSAVADYCKYTGVSYVGLNLTGDLFGSNARFFFPKADFPIKSVSASKYAEADFSDLRARLFSLSAYVQGWQIKYTPVNSATVLPSEFGTPVLYSIPAGSSADFEEDVYLFSVDEVTNTVRYVPSHIGKAPDAWGADSYQLQFETNLTGPFLAVNAQTNPGDLDGDESVSALDITVLAQSVAGWNVNFEYLNADVNGDGSLSAFDITVLAQSVAGWDVELSSFGAKV